MRQYLNQWTVGIVVGLSFVGATQAGWWWEKPLPKKEPCPPASYSSWNYLAPLAVRAHGLHHGPTVSPYPPVTIAESVILRYRCPAVDPAQVVAEREVLR